MAGIYVLNTGEHLKMEDHQDVAEHQGTAGKEKTMENEEMSKADLIAMLVSIREVARTNGEIHTVEHIDKILEEIRK